MGVLAELQPFVPRGLIISKKLMKQAIKLNAKPAEAAVAALEIIHVACEQTQTYMPAFLESLAAEMHAGLVAQKNAAPAEPQGAPVIPAPLPETNVVIPTPVAPAKPTRKPRKPKA